MSDEAWYGLYLNRRRATALRAIPVADGVKAALLKPSTGIIDALAEFPEEAGPLKDAIEAAVEAAAAEARYNASGR